MHPALSVIFFTVVSGTGYGLLFLLGLALASDSGVIGRTEALIALATGVVFAGAGLLSSSLHLGQPQRAWRAFSQWRSSWLSREGALSICGFAPALLLGLMLWQGQHANLLRMLGAMLALFALATVFCTARIYSSLKTIHAWHNGYVLPGYLLLGLLGGTSWMLLLHALFGTLIPDTPLVVILCAVSMATALCGFVCKQMYWRFIDTTKHPASIASATGLGHLGSVRGSESPHTEQNYLTHEMGFALARKHAKRLRTIALIGLGPVPIVAAAATWLLAPEPSMLATVFAGISVVATTAGLFVERWLFFAEARHVVMLYYDAAQPDSG